MVTGFVFHTMPVASAFMLEGNTDDRVLSLISGNELAAVHCPSRGYGEMGAVNFWSQNVEHVI